MNFLMNNKIIAGSDTDPEYELFVQDLHPKRSNLILIFHALHHVQMNSIFTFIRSNLLIMNHKDESASVTVSGVLKIAPVYFSFLLILSHYYCATLVLLYTTTN